MDIIYIRIYISINRLKVKIKKKIIRTVFRRVLSSHFHPLFLLRYDACEKKTRTFKLRSEWKIRETRMQEREGELVEREREDWGTTNKQEGRNRHVAVLRSTAAHNARKQFARVGEV